jgi:hypothetical protein
MCTAWIAGSFGSRRTPGVALNRQHREHRHQLAGDDRVAGQPVRQMTMPAPLMAACSSESVSSQRKRPLTGKGWYRSRPQAPPAARRHAAVHRQAL